MENIPESNISIVCKNTCPTKKKMKPPWSAKHEIQIN